MLEGIGVGKSGCSYGFCGGAAWGWWSRGNEEDEMDSGHLLMVEVAAW